MPIKSITFGGKTYDYPEHDSLSLDEGHLIKQMCGLGLAELDSGLVRLDPDFVRALCMIVSQRAGRAIPAHKLGSLTFNDIEIEFDDDEEDAETDEDPQPAGSASGDALSASNETSGSGETDPNSSGSPSTGTFSVSDQATSEA